MTAEKTPLSISSLSTPSKSALNGSDVECLAMSRLGSGEDREFSKKGGLVTMQSKQFDWKFCKAEWNILICEMKGEAAMFSCA